MTQQINFANLSIEEILQTVRQQEMETEIEQELENDLINRGITPLFVSKEFYEISRNFQLKEIFPTKESILFVNNYNLLKLDETKVKFRKSLISSCVGANVLIGVFNDSVSGKEKMQFNELKTIFLNRHFPVIRIMTDKALNQNNNFFKRENNVYDLCIPKNGAWMPADAIDGNEELHLWCLYLLNVVLGGLTKIQDEFDYYLWDVFQKHFASIFSLLPETLEEEYF